MVAKYLFAPVVWYFQDLLAIISLKLAGQFSLSIDFRATTGYRLLTFNGNSKFCSNMSECGLYKFNFNELERKKSSLGKDSINVGGL